jgi:RNA polymerase sigma-70 factor (ECF subfamily)
MWAAMDPQARYPGSSLSREAFESQIADHRAFLLRLARSQLASASAEDAVQETLLAAWRGANEFRGASAIRTWLLGILRFKIIDQIRANRRYCERVEATDIEQEVDEAQFDPLFDDRGRWADQPAEWYPDVSVDVAQRQLLRLLQACLERLPPNTSRVFLMREYLGFDTEEVCRETGFTGVNVRALLYRARMGLRSCLDVKIQAEKGEGGG